MTRHNEPEELLAAMLELPADEHDAFLDDQCGSDGELRAEVDRLRQAREPPAGSAEADADDDAGSFVEDLLGACSHELWQNPPGLPPTVAASHVSGTPPPALGDRYEILRELGHGGMGTVYLAKDNKLKRRVALKMLPEVCINQPRRRAMFEREACTAANLSHANVATVYEFEEFEGTPYIAMEYVEGRPLRQILAEERPLPLPKLLDFALQLTEGLHAAHRQSIIHRDLKPGNVMVTGDGVVKILDFGLAKALQTGDWDGETDGGPETVGSSGVLLGTPGYMSPEQARRSVDVDERTDLFSLGIVLYEMATGDGPFHRETPEECISAALNDTPQPVTALNSDLPPAVADVINKLLAKDRDARYQSAEQVLKDLRRLSASHEAEKWRMRLRSRSVAKKRGQRKWWVAAAVGALIVGAVILKNAIWPANPDPAVFEEIAGFAKLGDYHQAYALLGKEQKSFGEQHAMLSPLRVKLDMELRDHILNKRANLIQFLADGESRKADELLPGIKALEDLQEKEVFSRTAVRKTPPHKAVGELMAEARAKRQELVRTNQEIQGHVDKQRWLDALNVCQELQTKTFEGTPFRPAGRMARTCLDGLVQKIPTQAKTYRDPVKLDEAIDVLEKIKPDHPELPGLRSIRDRLNKERKLTRLQEMASVASSSEELAIILGEMDKIDPEHRLTKEVQKLLQAMTEQEAQGLLRRKLKANVIRTFNNRAQAELEVNVGTAREIGDLEDRDLESLDAAVKWLRVLNKALGVGVAELGEAENAVRRLGTARDQLPDYLEDAARNHLGTLDIHIKRCHQVVAGDLLYQDIIRLRASRQLPQARLKLDRLKAMKLPEHKAKVARAMEQLEQLASELEEERALDVRFHECLKSLHAREFGRAQVSLDALQHGWRKVRARLDAAIKASDEKRKAQLLLQRSRLNLMLGLPAAAVADAKQARALSENKELRLASELLWAQAEFAQSNPGGKRDPKRVSAALACLEKLGNGNPSVLYWKAVCRRDIEQYELARQDLENALRAGLDSADAHGLLAEIYFRKGKKHDATALEHANRAFQRPWTEGDLIAVFGRAPSAERARVQWRNALLNRAFIHARLEQWRECVHDCDASLALDSEFLKAKDLRKLAKSKLKKQP